MSGLLSRVCAFGMPGQCKTHGHSGFENDFEDLESDLLAASVANDVPAAFCAPEVFVDAAMIAYDNWGFDAWCRAFSLRRCCNALFSEVRVEW